MRGDVAGRQQHRAACLLRTPLRHRGLDRVSSLFDMCVDRTDRGRSLAHCTCPPYHRGHIACPAVGFGRVTLGLLQPQLVHLAAAAGMWSAVVCGRICPGIHIEHRNLLVNEGWEALALRH